MTQEQITKTAKQAGAASCNGGDTWIFNYSDLQRFAELVGNAKLEEAAKRFEQISGDELTPSQATMVAKELRSMKK